MQVHYHLPQTDHSAITIGSFDGLHRGHIHLLEHLKSIASENKLKTYVVSFEPHPRLVLPNNGDFKLLTTLDEKIELLRHIGIENLVVIPFDAQLSLITAEEFIQNYILQPLNPQAIVLGYDHKFGRDRKGSKETFLSLKRKDNLAYNLYHINEWKAAENKISSTTIRNMLQDGQILQANQLLGYSYSLIGKVVEGKKLGSTLGFPTANLKLSDSNKLIPRNGVYYTNVLVDDNTYNGATNIGLNPTTDEDSEVKIETYILDFNQNIYDKEIKLYFVERIRDELKFDTLSELIGAIGEDIDSIRKLIKF